MKTSILISSFAALCLLVTFAEAPRRHGKDKMIAAPTENITITTVNSPVLLSGPVITSERIKKSAITVPAVPAEDFSYLKFDVTIYTQADESTPIDEALPESLETAYGYLKFNPGDYFTETELPGAVITDLPEAENTAEAATNLSVPALNEFGYLRFDVNTYMSNSNADPGGIGELPQQETENGDSSANEVIDFTGINYSYLKFDVAKYYDPNSQRAAEQFELPEE
jgi:hypothetical protein